MPPVASHLHAHDRERVAQPLPWKGIAKTAGALVTVVVAALGGRYTAASSAQESQTIPPIIEVRLRAIESQVEQSRADTQHRLDLMQQDIREVRDNLRDRR